MKHNELKNAVLDVLEVAGFVVWVANAGSIRRNLALSPPGTPDIIGFGPDGRFVGIECKRDGDKIRPTQISWIARARAHGVYTAVVYTMDDIMSIPADYGEHRDRTTAI